MNTEFTHRADERGILRQIVSPAGLLDWLDADGGSYEKPASFGPEDAWDAGIPVMDGEEEAFARPESQFTPGAIGLTKREYFSAMAMQALIARDDLYAAEANDIVTDHAVRWADRLIASLNKIREQ